MNEINRMERSTERKKKYCHLHGEGTHSTRECKIVKLVEAKGWKRDRKPPYNKSVKYYRYSRPMKILSSVRMASMTKEKMFIVPARLPSQQVKVLLDTGADVSLAY